MKLLPIGTVVKIEHIEHLIMIIGSWVKNKISHPFGQLIYIILVIESENYLIK